MHKLVGAANNKWWHSVVLKMGGKEKKRREEKPKKKQKKKQRRSEGAEERDGPVRRARGHQGPTLDFLTRRDVRGSWCGRAENVGWVRPGPVADRLLDALHFVQAPTDSKKTFNNQQLCPPPTVYLPYNGP